MRFLVFAPEQHHPLSEGIQKSAWASVNALRAAGHTVEIISQTSYGTAPEVPYIINLSTSANRLQKYSTWIRQAITARTIYRTGNYDRIVVFSLDLSFILPLLFIRTSCPKTQIHLALFGTRECKGIFGRMLRVLRTPTTAVWCASPRMQELLADLGYTSAQIFCTPIFFTEPFITQSTTPIPRTTTTAYLSSADAGAGLDTILRLAQKMPERSWIIAIRKFSEKKELAIQKTISEIEALALPNLSVLRTIPDMTSFLLSVDSVILPPTNEDTTMAIPLVALEAHHLGVHVYMRNLPVFSELFARRIARPFSSEEELLHLVRNTETASSQSLNPLSSFVAWLTR